MRRLLTHTLLAALLVASAFAHARAQSTQQRADPPPPPRDPTVEQSFDTGRVEGETYTNDFFGFSMTLPKGWAVMGAAENKRILDTGKEIVEEGASDKKKEGLEASLVRTHFLVTASKYPAGTTGPGFNALLICIAERVPTAIVKTGADYISVMQRTFEGTAAKLEVGPLRTQNVGGAAFTVADVKMTAGPAITAQRYYIRITKGYALAMAYTYYDEADLKTLDDLLGTVKFK